MKIVQINTTCGVGSTGKICVGISQALTKQNIENYILFSDKSDGYRFGVSFYKDEYAKFQALKSRVFGNYGFNSVYATKRLIKKLDNIKPDIVHIHNIHSHDCNFEMLFNYLKENNIKVFYTFHDCWAFTGYCPHFTMAKCDNWKNGCGKCVLRKNYSWFFDKSAKNYDRKRNSLLGLDMTIITPSKWLAGLVKQSFLEEYPVKVINNGIDLSVFKPTYGSFGQKHKLDNKKVILGVSYGWSANKGLDVFIELAKRLDDEYCIVMVGTDDITDKQLPKNIISIHRTHNQQELAEIYTCADVFVNTTREENYPTVNMESIACGTPVLTFRTGGSPEMIDDTCGSVVECDNIDALEEEIIRICMEKPFSKEQCIKKAQEFSKDKRFKEYLKLYDRIVGDRE